jgi:nucleoside-diphosphate-sugar epimerase
MEPITFVTGGTGFLGRHLIPTLCRAGHIVRVLTRDPSARHWLTRYPRVEIVQGDVLDATLISEAVIGCTYIVHAAGLFRFWGNREAFEATNVSGAENILRAAAVSPTLKKLIHISTIALIGTPGMNRIVDEDHPAHPADNYQRSKLEAEHLALHYCAGQHVPVVILRPGAFYGPLGTYAFNRLFFKDPMRGIIMQVNGGRYVTFPVYIGDVAKAIVQAFECGRVGEVYNISGDSLMHKEAFDIICAEGNIHFPRMTIPGWLGIAVAQVMTAVSILTQREPFWPITLRSYVYNYWNVSSEKAKRELGFVPLDFREGARRTLAWYHAGQPDHLAELEC